MLYSLKLRTLNMGQLSIVSQSNFEISAQCECTTAVYTDVCISVQIMWH